MSAGCSAVCVPDRELEWEKDRIRVSISMENTLYVSIVTVYTVYLFWIGLNFDSRMDEGSSPDAWSAFTYFSAVVASAVHLVQAAGNRWTSTECDIICFLILNGLYMSRFCWLSLSLLLQWLDLASWREQRGIGVVLFLGCQVYVVILNAQGWYGPTEYSDLFGLYGISYEYVSSVSGVWRYRFSARTRLA